MTVQTYQQFKTKTFCIAALLPVCRFENLLTPLVSPPMYKNTGPPSL